MLDLDSHLQIPSYVVSSKVAESAVLLNTQTKKYFALDDVGMRFWDELKSGRSFRDVYETLLGEYDVAPNQLKNDLEELVQNLIDTGLVEIDQK